MVIGHHSWQAGFVLVVVFNEDGSVGVLFLLPFLISDFESDTRAQIP